MQKNLIHWLALLRTPNVGPVKFQQYLQQDPKLDTLPPAAVSVLQNQYSLIERDIRWAEQPNCHIILLKDDDYPPLLRAIHAPPPILFVKGNKKLLDRPQIAIVGSRNASNIGKQTAFKFSSELAKSNMLIISGLALGIDAASHEGALSMGSTIAVLAHGLDIIYPRLNYELSKRIVNQGAIISEFPLGVKPQAGHFPRRNRIISGLSLGVIVIEASIKSGSLITVQHALEQGKEIFAVPGSIYDDNVKGCHSLIKQGAKLVEKTTEVMEELGLNYAITTQNNSLDMNMTNKLDIIQTKILNSISYETTSIDLAISRSQLDPSIVNSTLVNLELTGYITSVPGGYAKLLLET
jgi:DNA processing protein